MREQLPGYPVIRQVRKLPSGLVEYVYVDDRGHVRRCCMPDNAGAFHDVQAILRKLAEKGIAPKNVPSGQTRSERMRELWQTPIR